MKSRRARGTREETRKRGLAWGGGEGLGGGGELSPFARSLARSRAARPNKRAGSHELSIYYILL